jgi:hypothetical protein
MTGFDISGVESPGSIATKYSEMMPESRNSEVRINVH